MSKSRSNFGIGVLDGVIYAVGGANILEGCNSVSVEAYRPSVGVWTPVADMLSGYTSCNYNIYIFEEYFCKNVLIIIFFI